MEETTIEQWFQDKARTEAKKLYSECDGTYVGAESNKKVKYKGYTYELFVLAFWESSNHFEYSVTGLDREYEQSKTLIDF